MGIEDILNQASAGDGEEEIPPTEEAEASETDVSQKPQEVQESVEAPVTEENESAEETPVVEEQKTAEPDLRDREIRELRQMLRESKIQMAAMREKVSGLDKKFSGEGEESEVQGNIEKLQQQIAVIAATKAPVLDVLVETMGLSPKYPDIEGVCSRAHFDDIFEMVARAEAQRSGKPFEEALLEAELSVWKMANPYKYMYNIIKTYHPDYAKKTPAAPTVQDTRRPVVAPSSVSNVGGGTGGGSGGWTAARIDAMDVSELDSVPADIYQKYLLGQLK